jgi:acetyltransferase-like isoleucine patch superfamily enzyme
VTLRGVLISLFPAALALAAAACLGWLLLAPGIWPAVALVSTLYLVAPLAYRIHARLCPQREGATRLVGKRYVPWWGLHQLELIYEAVPALEALLRLVPGLYSAWLRLWGSRIGKGVYWTPRVAIHDRGLLRVGDGVVFGDGATVYGHVIRRSRENLVLFVKPVTIGEGTLVGGHAVLGPGSRVEAGIALEAGAWVFPTERITADHPAVSARELAACALERRTRGERL